MSAMDLIKRQEFKQFATWLRDEDLLTDRVQLIPYELAELYLESEFYAKLCESQKPTSEPEALGLFEVSGSTSGNLVECCDCEDKHYKHQRIIRKQGVWETYHCPKCGSESFYRL